VIARAVLATVLLAWPVAAVAQSRPSGSGRIDVSVGGGLLSGATLGASAADLRANSTQPQPFRLFQTDIRFDRSSMVEVRAGYVISPRYIVEGRLGFGRPLLRASLTADAENAPAIDAVEQVDQYVIDVGIVVLLDRFRLGNAVPFATAGGGYLRQLHEGLTVVEEGSVAYFGGGARYPLTTRARGFLRSMGVRGDVRLNLLMDGIALEDGPRPRPAVSGSLYVVF
jgi:hypothetical protein